MVYPLLSHVHFVRFYPCNMYIIWCVSVLPSLSYTNMHTPYCFCFGTNVYCLPTKYENLICYKVCILLLNQVWYMSVFPLVSYMNMHIPIFCCCGAKRVLFTNKLSEYWCRIINPYLFTKFYTFTQHACSHCSLLWCEKGIVYQQVMKMMVSYHKPLHVYKVSYIQEFR